MTTPIDPSHPLRQTPPRLFLWFFSNEHSEVVSVDRAYGTPATLAEAQAVVADPASHVRPSTCREYVRADAHEEVVAALAKEEARVAALTEAINAMVEVSQNDPDTFDMVFGIAHDALKRCPACFPTDGRPARPLFPPGTSAAPVKSLPVIQTWGLACNNEHENAHCPFLETTEDESTVRSLADKGHCTKFDRALTVDPTMDIGLWVRCSLCLQEVP